MFFILSDAKQVGRLKALAEERGITKRELMTEWVGIYDNLKSLTYEELTGNADDTTKLMLIEQSSEVCCSEATWCEISSYCCCSSCCN